MARYYSLTCLVGKNKAGDFELIPLCNTPGLYYFFDIGKKGKYWRIRSGAVQKYIRICGADKNDIVNAVFSTYGSNATLRSIEKEKNPMSTSTANYAVYVKVVAQPTPSAIKAKIEEVTEVRNLFALVNIAYMACSQNGKEVALPMTFEKAVAIKIANILATDGALVEVREKGSNDVVFSPAQSAVEKVKPEAVKAAKKESGIDKEYFYVSRQLNEVASIMFAMAQQPDFGHTSLLVSGPSGWGKTAFAVPFAQKLGYEVVFMNMAKVLETEELFGTRQIKGGDTSFEFNEFVKACEAGKRVIVLDELNRTYPGALNALFDILDWRGTATIHGRTINVAPKTIFVATRNIGSSYVGTQATDGALANRFAMSVVVDSMPKVEEIKMLVKRTGVPQGEAARIVEVAEEVRRNRTLGVNISPRNTLEIARMVVCGVKVRAAYQLNVLGAIEEDEVRAELETLFNRSLASRYDEAIAASDIDLLF